MSWRVKAINLLKDSLYPIPSELNEIDWKSGLSPKTERLAQHICAFANQNGGGYFAFGVNDDASMFSVTKEEVDDIKHVTEIFEGHSLLFIHVPESTDKPTCLRGGTIYDTYRRSAGQTVKMTRQEVKQLIAETQGISFDEQIASEQTTADDVLNLLDDRIRACYQHCCLKYMEKERMTNQSFRERMEIEEKNYPMASKLIKETCNTGLIKEYQPENKSRKFTTYIPCWA